MKEIYDESGALTGYLVSPDEAICKICKVSVYSVDCLHTDPELIELVPKKMENELEKFSDNSLMAELLRREGLKFKFNVGAKVHWVEYPGAPLLEGTIINRYGTPPAYSIRSWFKTERGYKSYYDYNVPEHKLHHS